MGAVGRGLSGKVAATGEERIDSEASGSRRIVGRIIDAGQDRNREVLVGEEQEPV